MTHSTPKPQWRIDDTIASLGTVPVGADPFGMDPFSATVDLKRPSSGLQNIMYRSDKTAKAVPVKTCKPLQVSPEPPAPNRVETLIEAYVRGCDLIATYAQTPHRTVQPTYYWRSLNTNCDVGSSVPNVAGVELMISMQTSLLDSDPTLTALTECQGEPLWLSESGEASAITGTLWQSPLESTGFCLFRMADGISYVEMIFPADFLGAQITTTAGTHRLTHRMFPEDLEKGVIRRGRIRALFLPTQGDIKTAWTAYQQLRADDPPLTT